MASKIVVEERCESEVTVAQICAELVRQGVQFEAYLMPGQVAGRHWEITFTGGY